MCCKKQQYNTVRVLPNCWSNRCENRRNDVGHNGVHNYYYNDNRTHRSRCYKSGFGYRSDAMGSIMTVYRCTACSRQQLFAFCWCPTSFPRIPWKDFQYCHQLTNYYARNIAIDRRAAISVIPRTSWRTSFSIFFFLNCLTCRPWRPFAAFTKSPQRTRSSAFQVSSFPDFSNP